MKTKFEKAPNAASASQTSEASQKDVTMGNPSSGGKSKFTQAPGMSKNSSATGSIKDVTGGCEQKMESCKTSMKTTVKFSR